MIHLLLAALIGGFVSFVGQLAWERLKTTRLRRRLINELEDMQVIVIDVLQKKDWVRQEAKVQATRISNHYGAGDALEVTPKVFVKKELLDYLRFLEVFVGWFNSGGPFKESEISLEGASEGTIEIQDIAAKSALERFQFAQAQFHKSIQELSTHDPSARQRIERAANLFIVEAKAFLGGGVGIREVYKNIDSGLRDGLEEQSRLFYESLRTKTSNLLDLLAA